jgi:hypothetical protein
MRNGKYTDQLQVSSGVTFFQRNSVYRCNLSLDEGRLVLQLKTNVLAWILSKPWCLPLDSYPPSRQEITLHRFK